MHSGQRGSRQSNKQQKLVITSLGWEEQGGGRMEEGEGGGKEEEGEREDDR